jgi:uncharacterized membrane protein YccF (DUF307 family)
MSILGNIIWFVFGGVLIFLEYIISGLLLCLTIVGIPFGVQCIKLSLLGLTPFGRTITQGDAGSGCLAVLMNIIWILIGGIWIALTHLIFGILFGITIVGIPFARQHFKLASLALSPFGKRIA